MFNTARKENPGCAVSNTRDDKLASCEVRFVPNGTEVRVLRNGTLLWSRIFENGDEAPERGGGGADGTAGEGLGNVVAPGVAVR